MNPIIETPKLNHPELKAYYEYDLSIPKEKIATILALPRATLIEDLETILADVVERDAYFRSIMDEERWLEMPNHALWMLMELKAKKSLPAVLAFLDQDHDFADNWFGDSLTQDYWEILYFLGGDSLDALKKFALKPGDWAIRILPTSAAEQIALHQPERRAEIIAWFRSILDSFLALEADNPALDGDMISSVVGDLIDLKAIELLPQIKALHDRGLIYSGIVGTYTSIEKDIQDRNYPVFQRQLITSIFDRYQDVLTTWHGYLMRYDEAYKKQHTYKPPVDNKEMLSSSKEQISAGFAPLKVVHSGSTLQRTEEKVGRNEPCPCGSGKKYKKCCLRK